MRITILDEQVLFRESLARCLSAQGFTVVSEHHASHTFLRSLAQEPTDVALLDIQRAAGDGLTVLAESRQAAPQVRVLVLSHQLSSDVVDQCFRAGAAGYLDKATTRIDALLDGLNALARGENVVPADALESLLRATTRRDEGADILRSLSEREREVLSHLSVGADNLQIAALLKISERTVKAHVSNLYRKLGQENRTQLALVARQSGVRPPPAEPPTRAATEAG